MTWSKYSVFALVVMPLILWAILGPAYWEVYQFQMSLEEFSDMFNMLWFGFTAVYFMLLFVKVWSESVELRQW